MTFVAEQVSHHPPGEYIVKISFKYQFILTVWIWFDYSLYHKYAFKYIHYKNNYSLLFITLHTTQIFVFNYNL